MLTLLPPIFVLALNGSGQHRQYIFHLNSRQGKMALGNFGKDKGLSTMKTLARAQCLRVWDQANPLAVAHLERIWVLPSV